MKPPTRAEREYMMMVASLGCVACRNTGRGSTPAEVHHIRTVAGAGARAPHTLVIPLCPDHHRNGGHSVAIHAGQKQWESLYGSETGLLAQTILDVYLLTRQVV